MVDIIKIGFNLFPTTGYNIDDIINYEHYSEVVL